MWENNRPEGWKNPYNPEHSDRVEYNFGSAVNHRNAAIFEAGADAMYSALWKLAEESPTKTFTLDANVVNIYKENDDGGGKTPEKENL